MTDSSLHQLILARLATIAEPCGIAMGRLINICEMGLIEGVTIDGGHVTITLCLTDPGCVHFSALKKYIGDALISLDFVETVEVVHTTQVLWTPDRERPAGAPA
jgi:metal-sulfur cluster biosynthetic enzyme